MKNQKQTSKQDAKKKIKIADLKPKKDAKGGTIGPDHFPHKHLAGVKYE